MKEILGGVQTNLLLKTGLKPEKRFIWLGLRSLQGQRLYNLPVLLFQFCHDREKLHCALSLELPEHSHSSSCHTLVCKEPGSISSVAFSYTWECCSSFVRTSCCSLAPKPSLLHAKQAQCPQPTFPAIMQPSTELPPVQQLLSYVQRPKNWKHFSRCDPKQCSCTGTSQHAWHSQMCFTRSCGHGCASSQVILT